MIAFSSPRNVLRKAALTLAALAFPLAGGGQNLPARQLLPADAQPLSQWTLTGDETTLKAQLVPKGGAGSMIRQSALHLTVLKPAPGQYWKVQIGRPIPEALPSGTVLRLRFFARSKTGNSLQAVYEHTSAPYEKFLDRPVTLFAGWQETWLVFQVKRDIPADFAGLRFQIGQKAGEIEIADVQLEDFGVNPAKLPEATKPDLYGGRKPSPNWEAAANARIEKYRKGDLTLIVKDGGGKPVRNAVILTRQLNAKFRFGTAIADGPLLDAGTDGQKYREKLLQFFNCAVLENAMKWQADGWIPAERTEAMLKFCEAHHLPVRGHNLVWPSYPYLPEPVKNLRGAQLRAAVRARVKTETQKYRGRVYVWDVVNEAYTNTEVLKEITVPGKDPFVEIYRWARKADPTVGLAYNDYDVLNDKAGSNDTRRQETFRMIREKIAAGAPITSLGDQGHVSIPVPPADKIVSILEEWSQFKLPLEITEFDFTELDDARHAAYFREFLISAFSHPVVTSFVMWGFWEGAHWLGAEGGAIIRKDWTERPAAGVWRDLVLNQWRSKESGQTNRLGTKTFRLFLGEHKITVSAGGKTKTVTVSVLDNTRPQTLTVTLQ